MTANRTCRRGVMPGDGIGPEIVPASARVVDAALAAAGGGPVAWEELRLGASAIPEHGSAIPRRRWRGSPSWTAGCSVRTTARPVRSPSRRS